MSGGRRRLRTWQYGISSHTESNGGVSTLAEADVAVEGVPLCLMSSPDAVSGGALYDCVTGVSDCSPSPGDLVVGRSEPSIGFKGLLLLTLTPTTCPKALTPLSVLPHLEYSHPSQLGSSGPTPGFGVGKISLALFSAFHSSSSTVGNGVSLFGWYSRPLYRWPR